MMHNSQLPPHVALQLLSGIQPIQSQSGSYTKGTYCCSWKSVNISINFCPEPKLPVWYGYMGGQHAPRRIPGVSRYPECYLAQTQSLHWHSELSTTASCHQVSVSMQGRKTQFG